MSSSMARIPAVATLVGMILGVGMFGVPYVYAQLGFAWSVGVTLGVAVLVTVMHVLYAELVARAPVRVRLAHAAGLVFGPLAGRAVLCVHVLGLHGALLAYIIAGGSFAAAIFGLPDPLIAQGSFFVLFSLIALRGRAPMTRAQIGLVLLLIGSMVVLAGIALPYARVAHLLVREPAGLLVGYGVLLFALGGLPAIPTVVESLGRSNGRQIRWAVIVGTVFSVAMTAGFGLVVAAATGPATSQEAVGGLVAVAGQRAVVVGALMGLLAVVTSFLALAVYVRDLFLLDAHLPKPVAWACTLVPPFLLFLVGARELIPVVTVTGGIFGGIDGMTVAAISLAGRMKKKRGVWLPLVVLVSFAAGIAAHVLRTLQAF